MAKEERAKAPAQAAVQVAEKGLLDQIVEDGRVGTDVATRERGKSLVKEFINQVLEGEVTVSKDVEAMIMPEWRRLTTCSPSNSMRSCTIPSYKNSRQPGAG